MSDIHVDGFKASKIIVDMAGAFDSISETERKALLKKTNAIFELEVTNEAKEKAVWTIDMKKSGTVYKGKAKPKADVTIILGDDVLVGLSDGTMNGQKAFMSGKMKVKGNMMLATKLEAVLKTAKDKTAKAKL